MINNSMMTNTYTREIMTKILNKLHKIRDITKFTKYKRIQLFYCELYIKEGKNI